MTQAHCRITVHFITAAKRLSQALVIIDEHTWQRIEQIRGKFCPLGFGQIEGERFNFGECCHGPENTPDFSPVNCGLWIEDCG